MQVMTDLLDGPAMLSNNSNIKIYKRTKVKEEKEERVKENEEHLEVSVYKSTENLLWRTYFWNKEC